MNARVELARDHAGGQTPVRGQDLVRPDHREAVAERDDDPGLDAGQLRRQDNVLGHVDQARASTVVVPVHPEQVQGMRRVRLDGGEHLADSIGDLGRVSQLAEGGEDDALVPEPADGALVDVPVD